MAVPINQYALENNTVFSIAGKGLKLNTAQDVQEFVETIEQMPNLEVIELSGNTLGVEASQALAQALKTKTHLKVKFFIILYKKSILILLYSKPYYPTSLQVVY